MQENPSKLTDEQIATILKRCIGSDARAMGIKEIGGGTFNETYVIEIAEKEKVVLKVAPAPVADLHWDDVALMRREHNILPFFAPTAPLMPKTICADFTHQIIPRDYVLQTFLEGDRWSDIEDELTDEENIDLWRQCGEIVKRMHETTGERFGYPYPGKSFANWHAMILDRFSRIGRTLKEYQAEISSFSDIFDVVRSSQTVFHDIHTPRLLHGDLWTFNLLVTRQNGTPLISGVLDAERAWWGDPLADWVMFCLSVRNEEEEWQQRISAFFAGYGGLDKTTMAQFRREAYDAMHIGSSVVWAVRQGKREDIERGRKDLERIADVLPKLLN